MANNWQPIVAQCTPSGSGAIALIRLSGMHVRELVAQCSQLSSKKSIKDVATHTINHGYLHSPGGELIDEVLFLVMDGPRSYTGEDTIEITCHNNPFIIQNILSRLCALGARPAQRGEFTLRAYENKKIDLLQAEAVADIIHAQSEAALKASLAQLKGSLSSFITDLEKEIVKIAAWTQASLEFLEEERDFRMQILQMIEEVLKKISHCISLYAQHAHIREGVRIAILGAVNAGKSSLFNRLLNKNRSIVTDIPGTTRDTVEAGVYREGLYLTFIDTAGIRVTEDKVEQEGVRRSYEEAEKADIVLVIYDVSRHMSFSEHEVYEDICKKHAHKIIQVFNKTDLPFQMQSLSHSYARKSEKADAESIFLAIDACLQDLVSQNQAPFLLNARQHQLLASIEEELSSIREGLQKPIVHYEMILAQLHDALSSLAEVTGRTASEQTLDMVFKEFCVGK